MNGSLLELERRARPELGDDALVQAIAARVIEELGIVTPPVNLDMVRSWLDIDRIVEDPRLAVAGCLLCRVGNIEIRVRAGDSPGRKRFTVAHECAHTFFPGFELQPQYRCSPGARLPTTPSVEALCDIAASELLFPAPLFIPAAAATRFDFDGVGDLAEHFGASLLATAFRMTAALREDTAVLVFEPANKPRDPRGATPKLRLQSFRCSSRWAHFLRHKSATPGDPFHRALHGELVSETTIVQGVCVAPAAVEVNAQLSPYIDDRGMTRHRVLALLRRVERPGRHG